ncbi:hypothetical protein OSTOST_03240 [Ostertagia ostertagi]
MPGGSGGYSARGRATTRRGYPYGGLGGYPFGGYPYGGSGVYPYGGVGGPMPAGPGGFPFGGRCGRLEDACRRLGRTAADDRRNLQDSAFGGNGQDPNAGATMLEDLQRPMTERDL